MKKAPTFSVVIPLYNHERYITPALQSVLEQTLPARDIVVVDDGSSDNGYAVAEKLLREVPNAKIVRQDNRGAHSAINRAIELSEGSHIAVLNSDDIFKSSKLHRCSKLFISDPEISLVFGNVEIIDTHGDLVPRNETTDWLSRSHQFYQRCRNLSLALLNENFAVTTSNFVFSRKLWSKAGGFKNLRYCHDLDFLMASARFGKLHFDEHGGNHISYRVHPENTIKEAWEKIQLEIAGVMLTSLDGSIPSIFSEDVEIQRAIEGVIDRKSLGSKIASLLPYRRSFNQRDELYEHISGNGVKKFLSSSAEVHKGRPNSTSYENKQQLTVAIELSQFDKGGLEKVVLDCAIDFRRCGVNPIIVSCGEIGKLGELARAQAIETVKLPEENGDRFYEDLLKSRKVDIAMSHFSTRGYPIFRKLGIPNITFIHNIYAMLRDKSLSDFLEADQYVDKYISVSQLATDYVVEKYGLERAKIITIPNGLILEEHFERLNQQPAARSKFAVAEEDYLFLNVASYNLHKAHYLMADAMRLVLRKRDDIKILCVGNVIYPPHIEQLRADIEAWGLSNHILMPGYFDDVSPLHKMADAFLLPSLIEGWSIAMNEAMFYGKPMILTETGGAPQVINNSDIGLLIPNEYGPVSNLDSFVLDRIGYEQRNFQTAPYLANAMIQFADNKDAWRRKGMVGHHKIVSDYGFSSVTEKYVSVCWEVLQC